MTIESWSHAAAVAVVVFSVSGCFGGRGTLPLGSRCADNGECDDGYVCAYGRCRPMCSFDSDCAEGMDCVVGPEGVLLCMTPSLIAEGFEDDQADDWDLWRTEFDVVDGRLTVSNAVRDGFDYGQLGNGRMAVAHTHRGDASWTDYRVELDAESTGLGDFGDVRVDECYRGFGVYFRVVEDSESWNEPARTCYVFALTTADCTDPDTPRGYWQLARIHGFWIEGLGWSDSIEGTSRNLASGVNREAIVDGPNHVQIDAVGQRIAVSVNDVEVVEFEDAEYDAGEAPITFGGVGVYWGWESLGWLDNVVVTAIDLLDG